VISNPVLTLFGQPWIISIWVR